MYYFHLKQYFNITFFYIYLYDYEMKYHCKKPFQMNFKNKFQIFKNRPNSNAQGHIVKC